MIAHKKLHIVFLGIIILLCMVIPVSASPSLDDATFELNVKAYFLKYTYQASFTYRSQIFSDGTFLENTDYYCLTSDFIPVHGGGSFCWLFDNAINSRYPSSSCCFYDSSYNIVLGGTDEDFFIIDVPFEASYIRFSQRYTGSRTTVLSSYHKFTSLNDPYLWGEIENVSFSDNAVIIPYQSYGFNRIQLDVMFYDNNRPYDSLSVGVRTEYDNTSLYSGLVNYSSDSDFFPYIFLDSISWVDDEYSYYSNSSGSSSLNNPCKLYTPTENGQFVGFRLSIPINAPAGVVSTGLKIFLTDFILDDVEKDITFDADSDLIIVRDRVNHVRQDLELPAPDFEDIFGGIDSADSAYNQGESQIIYIFHGIYQYMPIVGTFILISVTLSVLGYILFGKSG